MNKEQKVISQPLAKKIHDKAKEKGFELMESEYCWWFEEKWEIIKCPWVISQFPDAGKYLKGEIIPAFDCAELGEMLPRMIKIDDKKIDNKRIIGIFRLHFYKNDYEWLLQYKEWHGSKGLIITDAETEAEVRGKMFLYLLGNDLL